MAVKSIKRHTKSPANWSGLVRALQKRTTISRAEFVRIAGKHTRVSADYALWRLQRDGVLSRIGQPRRGLYLVVQNGGEAFAANPIEAVQTIYGANTPLAYGTALFVHGLSRYGRLTEHYVIGPTKQRPKELGEFIVRFIKSPLPEKIGIVTRKYGRRTVCLTDLERTLIDCIHRPKYAQGWENVVHTLHRAKGVRANRMIAYVKLYRTPSLVARVGLVLGKFTKKWRVGSEELGSLRQYLPRTPVKFSRRLPGKLNKTWNLYVPEGVFDE